MNRVQEIRNAVHFIIIRSNIIDSDMKTDSLFYELFKAYPASLFELAGLEVDGQYVFESITVKTTMQSSKFKV